MRLLDQDPIDPEIAATLDAIDATLAGEPVDAQYAELAEIALLLASDRPQLPAEFARSMDERVGRRFAPAPDSAVAGKRARGPRMAARLWGAGGALAAGVALVGAIVVVTGGGGGASSMSSSSAATAASSGSSAGSSAAATGSTAAASSPPAAGPTPAARVPGTSSTSAGSGKLATVAPGNHPPPVTLSASGSASASAGSSAGTASPALQPPTTGRKVAQSAQLNLTAAPSRVDAVAQEVYNVVGQVNGIVNSSTVTQGGPNGYASFQLSVPSASLSETMSRLSQLTYAQVTSRTDNTQDITNQYNAAASALADARALRTSLLKQLANAVTTAQVDSLTAQIHDAEASISSDEATLGRLNNQVNFSQINVEINTSTPPPIAHKSGGFGIGRAAHDAGRVLTVAAGGALIAIAALTPVALVIALVWWVGAAFRRRRREQALDSV
jgi:Domain of unknown function (DUF4349)